MLLRQSLVDRLTTEHTDIAACVIDEAIAQALHLPSRPASASLRELGVEVCSRLMLAHLELFTETDRPDEQTSAYVRAYGAASSARGVPLTQLVENLSTGHLGLVRQIWARTEISEVDLAATLTTWSTRALHSHVTAVTAGYYEHLRQSNDRELIRQLYTLSVLQGQPDHEQAARCGIVPHDQHWVLTAWGAPNVLRPRSTPPEIPDSVLVYAEDGDAVICLIPGSDGNSWATVEAVADAYRRWHPFRGFGASAAPEPAAVPASVARARWTAQLAYAARLSGPATLDHVLPEAAIAYGGEAQDRLLKVANSLGVLGALVDTLTTLYENDLDRLRTAAVLGIHRRTLSLRLAKIEKLTGINPISVRGIHTFHGALAALRLQR